MIRVSSFVQQIADRCFTQEEKSILEYEVGTIRMSVASQLKYYYKTACWEGTEQELYEAICQRKEERIDLLKKLKSLNERINQAIDPASYDEVYIRLEGTKFSSSTINTNSDGATSTARSTEDTSGSDKSDSWSISDSRDAAGQMDEVNKLQDVWTPREITHASSGQNPSIVKGFSSPTEIKYRQFTAGAASSEDSAVSTTAESTTRDDTSNASSSSLGVNVNKHFGDRNVGGRKYKVGEQLLNMWKEEIPNIRNKYFRIFEGLFIYERYY